MKDYYEILGINRQASQEEIKKAFRRQALLHHPDKLRDGAPGSAKFAAIREAYGVLSDKAKRIDYHAKFFSLSPDRVTRPLPDTPDEILADIRQLANKVLSADPFRLNHDWLYGQLAERLSEHQYQLLKNAEPFLVADFADKCLAIAACLPFPYLTNLFPQLDKLPGNEKGLMQKINSFKKYAKWQHFWNRYKIIIALAISLLISMAIYYSV